MNHSPVRRKALALACAAWAGVPARAEERHEPVAVQIGPFGAGANADAQALNQGLASAIEEANARGGVRGRRLKLLTLDDRRDADLFVKRFHEAMALKPVALLCPLGSTLVKRLLDDRLLDTADTVVLNAIPGAEVLRSPGHPRLFHIRAGDRQQIQYLVRHAATLGIRRLVVWHQDTPAGRSGAGLAGASSSSSAAGTAPVAALEAMAVESAVEAPAMAAAALKVKEAGAASALVLGSPTFMAEAVKHLRTAGHSGPIYAPADLPLALLLKVAGDAAARGVSIARCVPNPEGVAQPVQRAFAAAMRAAHPDVAAYTALQMEGYLSARVLVDGLRRAAELRPTALADALRAAPIDLGGFRVDFRDSQAGSAFVDIGVVTSGGRLAH